MTVRLVCPATVNDVEESEGLPALDKPGWYSQGNWPHLHELLKTTTGKPEPTVRLIQHTSWGTEHGEGRNCYVVV